MKKLLAAFVGLILAGWLPAQETVETKAAKPSMKICVMNFMTVDEGAFRLIPGTRGRIVIPEQCTLKNEDRTAIDSVMQGYVRMIDAEENARQRKEEHRDDTAWLAKYQEKQLELYKTAVTGKTRPAVIGAEYLTAYLGRYSTQFGCVETKMVEAAMRNLQQSPDFPKDFMARLAQETGVTHLVFCTVSDMRTKENSFKGYGIETKSTTCQLDVILRLVDLKAGHTVYSNVYTGTYRERRPISIEQFDNNIFQNLMTSALEQAAEELHDVCDVANPDSIFHKQN